MKQYHDVQLQVWQQACRHIDINESLMHIAHLLLKNVSFQVISLFFIDSRLMRVERLCFISCDEQGSIPQPIEPDAVQVKHLLRWFETASLVQIESATPPPPFSSDFLEGLGGYVLALPFVSEHGFLGLLFVSRPDTPFVEHEQQLIELLREPLMVALENDRRLHELVTLREAAEADKIKLLHRLGREELRDDIVGANDGLHAVMKRVHLVARSDVPVLLFGETGSGKEVVARAIHERSPRAAGPFIRVNCGAIPPELIDSELFGHERGSFTGAVSGRKGWFERADGGTLFLDEIGELPQPAQVRLLRVLQDGSFERVGGERLLHANVRIVAATHRDLARMVQEHAFREDLWYRIAVFPIVLPPLRERQQDIPALAEHFAQRAARRFGLRPQSPSPEDIELLCAYHWPGNVRELASVLDRAAILGDGKGLEVALALGIVPTEKAPEPSSEATCQGEVNLVTLDEAMRLYIERILSVTYGKIEGSGGAAALLDINPHTLRARMRKLGIDWQSYRR